MEYFPTHSEELGTSIADVDCVIGGLPSVFIGEYSINLVQSRPLLKHAHTHSIKGCASYIKEGANIYLFKICKLKIQLLNLYTGNHILAGTRTSPGIKHTNFVFEVYNIFNKGDSS